MPPITGACTLWPLYQVMAQSQAPVRALIRQVGRDAQVVEALAVSEQVSPASFTAPAACFSSVVIHEHRPKDSVKPAHSAFWVSKCCAVLHDADTKILQNVFCG